MRSLQRHGGCPQHEDSSPYKINTMSQRDEGVKGGFAMKPKVIFMKDVRDKWARQNIVVADIALQKYLKDLVNWLEEPRAAKLPRAGASAIKGGADQVVNPSHDT